ncbi:MAG: ATP-binding cassette domain-containing protein [Acidimicrobiaceae bacterium]|nr:ATP-binding cassette domain-containing protein [Acidimicrobiaceae bacterium]
MKTKSLTLGFGGSTVLDGVSLEFPRGSITSLIGPSGSGKTTFLRSLNRMNDGIRGYRRQGEVLLDSASIWDSAVNLLQLRRRVGMLFQRANPFPMSIRENVLVGVKAHGLAKRNDFDEITETLLKEVGLWKAVSDRLNGSPFSLSGGQQQLLCLARALAVRPEVLLLDEPTSALDPFSIELVENLIAKLAPKVTFVVVTHNLAQARRLSHATAFFFQGRLAEYGPTNKIFTAPSQLDTQRYVSGSIG